MLVLEITEQLFVRLRVDGTADADGLIFEGAPLPQTTKEGVDGGLRNVAAPGGENLSDLLGGHAITDVQIGHLQSLVLAEGALVLPSLAAQWLGSYAEEGERSGWVSDRRRSRRGGRWQ